MLTPAVRSAQARQQAIERFEELRAILARPIEDPTRIPDAVVAEADIIASLLAAMEH